MNMVLLERHAYEEHEAAAADWLFVAAMVLLLVLIAVVPFVVLGWLIGGSCGSSSDAARVPALTRQLRRHPRARW